MPTEIALVSFSDRELRPILETTGWFTIGNFAAECDFSSDGGIDIFICVVSGE